jgi:hypothetical protein
MSCDLKDECKDYGCAEMCQQTSGYRQGCYSDKPPTKESEDKLGVEGRLIIEYIDKISDLTTQLERLTKRDKEARELLKAALPYVKSRSGSWLAGQIRTQIKSYLNREDVG